MVLKRTDFVLTVEVSALFGTGVFGDGFGTLTNSVLSQFTGQQKTHRGLNFPAGDRRPFIIVSQSARFCSDPFKDVVHETVHDAHCFARNSCIRMDLLQYFVDIDCVAFLPLTLLLLVAFGNVLLSFTRLLGCFTASFRWHLCALDLNNLACTPLARRIYYGFRSNETTPVRREKAVVEPIRSPQLDRVRMC